MGLDSVELLMSVEEKFNIEIPNEVSERIYTVGQFAQIVYERIPKSSNESTVFPHIFQLIEKAFKKLDIKADELSLNDKIKDLIKPLDLKNTWNLIENELGIKLPLLTELDLEPQLNSHIRFLRFNMFKRSLPVSQGTIQQLIDWVVSINYSSLIDTKQTLSIYEIERIICGMTSEKMGIPINEIELHHSFTNDLGID